MREIKFRGKRVDNGEWVYGYYYEDSQVSIKPQHYILIIGDTCLDPVEVIHETVGQYINYLDKNNKEIYDDDIIKYGTSEEQNKEIVDYCINKYFIGYEFGYKHNLEVIGNTHDNPELHNENI